MGSKTFSDSRVSVSPNAKAGTIGLDDFESSSSSDVLGFKSGESVVFRKHSLTQEERRHELLPDPRASLEVSS